MHQVEKILITEESTLRSAMLYIDRGAKGIVLVVDKSRHLIATLTDGDLRRAVLAGLSLELPVADLIQRFHTQGKPGPISLPVNSAKDSIVREMKARSIRQVPLVDEDGRVVDLAVLDELVEEPPGLVHAVVMAGGFGKRLMPLTAQIPKPLLRVGDRPLIDRLMEQLKQAGVSKVNVSTHYKAEQISTHLGDGEAFGIPVEYVAEEQPMGTAGGLSLISGEEPLLVINGDILTGLDFRSLLNFHFEHHAEMTVAVREYRFDVPYGVVETDGVNVTGVTEKPTLKFFVNAGIYLISSSARQLIPSGQKFDMPELIDKVVQRGGKVISFPVWEYWLDIGRHEDYQRAQEDVRRIEARQ
jgi:dTDP-glucose pyrophosphorylase/CBS domain-containing protein